MKTTSNLSYESIAESLKGIRIPRRYCGFQRIVYILQLVLEDECRLNNLRAKVYPLVAEQCDTSVASIESSLRTIIHEYWKSADRRILWEIFRQRGVNPPTVSQFIESLADYVQKTLLEGE